MSSIFSPPCISSFCGTIYYKDHLSPLNYFGTFCISGLYSVPRICMAVLMPTLCCLDYCIVNIAIVLSTRHGSRCFTDSNNLILITSLWGTCYQHPVIARNGDSERFSHLPKGTQRQSQHLSLGSLVPESCSYPPCYTPPSHSQ